MKRILIATDSFLPRWDGISRFLNEIIPKLSGFYQIKVIAPNFRGDFTQYPGVEVIRVPLSRFQIADYIIPKPSYAQVKAEVAWADIVWTQTVGPIGSMSIHAAKKQRKKVVAYIHSIEWELFPKSLKVTNPLKFVVHKSASLLTKHLYSKCDLLLVSSSETETLLKKRGIKTAAKVVPLGTNTKLFSPPDEKSKAKFRVDISPDKLVVGFAGRIGNEKDLNTLYRAFGRIHRKHNAVLLIVGQDLANVTDRFLNHPRVKLIGSTNDIVPYFQAMDVYVLSSLTETSSLSTMEAMSCGCAVIATRVGSVKDYVIDNYNGLFFPKQDAHDLSKKIDLLLEDEFLRKRLSSNARRTIIDRFSWDKTVEKLKDAFDHLE